MARHISCLKICFLGLVAMLGVGACGSSNLVKIGVQVSPLCAAVPPGGSQHFDANIFIDDVDQGIDNAAVSWSVFGGDVNGVIDADGNYTAPDTVPPPAAQVTVIATSKEDNQKVGQATTVLSGACPVVPPPSQSF